MSLSRLCVRQIRACIHKSIIFIRSVFPSYFPTNILYALLIFLVLPTCRPPLTPLIWSHSSMWWRIQIMNSSLRSFIQPPVTVFLLDPNILPAPCSQIFAVCVLHLRSETRFYYPYKTTGKIIVLCILIFPLSESRQEGRRFCTAWWLTLSELCLLSLSSLMQYPFMFFI
jgi:hypothetical protein